MRTRAQMFKIVGGSCIHGLTNDVSMFVPRRFPMLLVAAVAILTLPSATARSVPGYEYRRAGKGPDWKPYGPGDHGHHCASDGDVPYFTFNELWDMQNAFFTQFMYPNNVPQATSINSTLLAPNVSKCDPDATDLNLLTD